MTHLIKYILLMLTTCFALSSCSNEDESVNYKPKPSPFSVQVNQNTTVGPEATQITATITAGTDGWWIDVPTGSWCGFNSDVTSYTIYGSGNKTITIYIAANKTGESRTQTVTFHPTFGLQPVTVNIIQRS